MARIGAGPDTSGPGDSTTSDDDTTENRSTAEQNFDRLEGSDDEDTSSSGGSSSDSDSDSGGSSPNRSTAEQNFERLEGSDSDSEDSSKSSGSGEDDSTSNTEDGSDDFTPNRSTAEQNFDRLQNDTGTATQPPSDPTLPDDQDPVPESPTRRNFDRLQDQETSTPDEGQGAGAEVFGEGVVLDGQVVSEAEAEDQLESMVAEDPDIDRGDVRVDIGPGGTVTFALTAAGASKFEGEPGETVHETDLLTTQEAATQIEEQAIEESGAQNPTDIVVGVDDEGFTTDFTVSGQESAIADQLGIAASDISVEGEDVVSETNRGEDALEMRSVEESLRDRYPDAERLSISQVGDDEYQYEVTTGAGETVGGTMDFSPQPQRSPRPVNQRTRRAIAKEEIAAQASEEMGMDISPSDVQVTETEDGGLEYEITKQEAFDRDWSFGLGGPDDEVEGFVDEAGERAQAAVQDVGAWVWAGGMGEFLSQPLRGEDQDLQQAIDVAEERERSDTVRRAEYVTEGVAMTPALPLLLAPSALELGEAIEEGGRVAADEVGESELSGRSTDEFEEDVISRASAMGSSSAQYIRQNTEEVIGTAAGAVLGTGILFGATAGTRVGTAARWTIQPGEEIVTSALTRAARRSARGQRLVNRLPGGRVDVEEIGLVATQRAASRVRDVTPTSRLEADIARFRETLSPSRWEVTTETRFPGQSPIVVDDSVTRSLRQDLDVRDRVRGMFSPDGSTVPGARNPLPVTDLETQLADEIGSAASRVRSRFTPDDSLVPGARNPLPVTNLETQLAEEIGSTASRVRSYFSVDGTQTIQGARNPLGRADLQARLAAGLAGGSETQFGSAELLSRAYAGVAGVDTGPLRLPKSTGRTDLGRPLLTDLRRRDATPGLERLSELATDISQTRIRISRSVSERPSTGDVEIEIVDDTGNLRSIDLTGKGDTAVSRVDSEADVGGGQVGVLQSRVETEVEETGVGTDMVNAEYTVGRREMTIGAEEAALAGVVEPAALERVGAAEQGLSAQASMFGFESDLAQDIAMTQVELAGLDQALEQRAGLETEMAVEQDGRLSQQLAMEQAAAQEVELEGRAETRTDLERDGRQEEEDTDQDLAISFGAERGSSVEESLSAGWLNEFTTAFALGAGPRAAPSEETLQEESGAVDLTEQRPTEVMISGTEEEKEAIADAERFLFFGESESDEGGGLL